MFIGFHIEGSVVVLSFDAALVVDWRFALSIVSHKSQTCGIWRDASSGG